MLSIKGIVGCAVTISLAVVAAIAVVVWAIAQTIAIVLPVMILVQIK